MRLGLGDEHAAAILKGARVLWRKPGALFKLGSLRDQITCLGTIELFKRLLTFTLVRCRQRVLSRSEALKWR